MPNDRTGHKTWGPWSFDYAVSDSEGLTLLNGSFKGRSVFGKFSMPVIRVKYLKDGGPGGSSRGTTGTIGGAVLGGVTGFFEGGLLGAVAGAAAGGAAGHALAGDGAGPFADQISWNLGGDHGLQKIANRNNEYVGLNEFTTQGQRWLEICIYARIGAYHLAQQWYFSDTGFICPRIFSKGLHINMDHTHHPYWRLDFDIDGPDHNRVYMKDNKGWWTYPKEANDVKERIFVTSIFPWKVDVSTNRRWFVHNEQTGRGAWITPGAGDGVADGWSRIDMAVRRYNQPEETNPWPFGTGGLGFLNGEDVSDGDVVLWYVAHLFHRAAEGADHWHGAGPDILIDGY